ncbi:MAG: SpaA isopeptide-forming pilin-related protein, partial [Longicatena sp.]
GLVTRTLDDLGIADSVVGSMVGDMARYNPDQMYANAISNPQDAKKIWEGTVGNVASARSILKNGDLVIQRASDVEPYSGFGHVAFIHLYGNTIAMYGANNPVNGVSDAILSTSAKGTPTGQLPPNNYITVFRLAEDIQPTYATLNATKSANENVLVSLTKTDVDNNKVLSNVTFDFYRDNVKFETSTTNGNGIATANFAKSYTATSGTKTYCTNYDQLDANGKQKVANAGAFAYQSQAQSSADTEAQNSANAMANQNHSYMAIETVAKTKYWLNSDNDTVTNGITGSGNVSMSLTNKRVLGTANITKTDYDNTPMRSFWDRVDTAQGDATLEGAVYGLYARENILDPADDSVIYRANTLIKSVTITNSKASVSDLYLGKYYWKEIKASEGYKLDPNEHDITLNYEDENTLTIVKDSYVFEHVITGRFDIEKIITDGENSEIVDKEEGAEFLVVLKKYVTKYGSIEEAYEHRDEYTEKEYEKLVTDEDGYAWSDDLAYGTYVVKQIKGQIDTDKYEAQWEFKVDNEDQDTIHYIINNRPFTSYLKLVKKDLETNKEVVLSSATFKIWDVKNQKYISQKVGETHISEFKTDTRGYVVLPLQLKAGEYRLDEIHAPKGYLINTESVNFKITNTVVSEVDKDGDPIQIIEFSNMPVKGRIEIKKNGEVLTTAKTDKMGNVHFGYEEQGIGGMKSDIVARKDILDPADGSVLIKAGSVVETLVTGTNGKATSSPLPLGDYYVIETDAPKGFTINKEKQNVSLEYKDETTALISKSTTIDNERQKVNVSMLKQDFDNNTPLSGAIFGLYAKEDIFAYSTIEPSALYNGRLLAAKGTLIETQVTDEDGNINFEADLPLNLFEIKEIKAPIGYATNDISQEVDATYQGQDVSVIEVDKIFKNKITKVEISKTDITTDKELAGNHLSVYEKDNKGNVFDTWISTNETHLIKGLEVGKTYVLHEVSSAFGFAIAKDVEFTIQDTGEVQKVKMENKLVEGKLVFNKEGNIFMATDTGQTEVGEMQSPVWEKSNLLGAEITLYPDEDITLGNNITYFEKDQAIQTLTSDWEAVESQLLPVGKYYYVETKAPLGYVQDNEKHYFEIEDNQKDELQIIQSTLKNERPTYELDFTKHLEVNDIENPEAYKDVVFGVYTRDDTYNYKGDVAITPNTLVYTSGIDEKGKLTTDFELPVGNYFIKELATNEAYVLETKEYDFLISQSNEAKVKVSINEGKPLTNDLKDFKVLVNKVDSQTKKNVISKDFEFTRYANKECTKEIDKAVANTKDGNAMFDDIHYGITYIKETKAPQGYRLSDEVVKIEVNNEGVFVNDKKYSADDKDVYSIIYLNSLLPSSKVETGDNTNINILLSLAGISTLSLAGLFVKRTKRKKDLK